MRFPIWFQYEHGAVQPGLAVLACYLCSATPGKFTIESSQVFCLVELLHSVLPGHMCANIVLNY